MKSHLYRSANNRWIVGICGGIAEYTKVPSILLRLLFVALYLVVIPYSMILCILIYIVATPTIYSPKIQHTNPLNAWASSMLNLR